jgi:hypothetical protein
VYASALRWNVCTKQRPSIRPRLQCAVRLDGSEAACAGSGNDGRVSSRGGVVASHTHAGDDNASALTSSYIYSSQWSVTPRAGPCKASSARRTSHP